MSEQKKPSYRELHLNDGRVYKTAKEAELNFGEVYKTIYPIHVIEYAALTAAQERIRELESNFKLAAKIATEENESANEWKTKHDSLLSMTEKLESALKIAKLDIGDIETYAVEGKKMISTAFSRAQKDIDKTLAEYAQWKKENLK